MPRMLRVEFEGAMYHVMGRGNNGQPIYLGDPDREAFVKTLAECCRMTGWRIHAYVLMDNHYHLLLETPEANLVSGMKWLQGTYTQRFNRANGRRGHLFQGRYKAVLVDPGEPEYFQIVADYIHLNPVRARKVDPRGGEMEKYPWSSCGFYLKPQSRRPEWLETGRVLECAVHGQDCTRTRIRYRQYLHQRAVEELGSKGREGLDKKRGMVRRGWMIGGKALREKALDILTRGDSVGTDNCRGDQRRDHGERRAEYLIQNALTVLHLNEGEMLKSKGTRPEKQALAWLVRQNTIVTGVWVANRLRMGHRVNVSRAVSAFDRARDPERIEIKSKMLQCTG